METIQIISFTVLGSIFLIEIIYNLYSILMLLVLSQYDNPYV